MNRRRVLILVPVLVIVLVALVPLFWGERENAPPQRVSCPDLRAGCSGRLEGQAVTMGVSGELKALKPFEVWVRAEGARKVQARFDMVGMNMGFNLYTLHADPQGVFRARVTLPMCVSGRRDWVMTVDVDGDRLEVPFATEL